MYTITGSRTIRAGRVACQKNAYRSRLSEILSTSRAWARRKGATMSFGITFISSTYGWERHRLIINLRGGSIRPIGSRCIKADR